MDITTIAIYLASGTSVAILLTQVVKGFFEKYISPRFEPTITQLILFVFCLIIAAMGIGWGYLPHFLKEFLGLMFAGGIAIYEVFKGIFVGKKE